MGQKRDGELHSMPGFNSFRVSQVQAALRAGETTANEVAKASRKRLMDMQSTLNAVTVFSSSADIRSQAERSQGLLDAEHGDGGASPKPRSLAGVPVLVKDCLDVKGFATTLGSKEYCRGIAGDATAGCLDCPVGKHQHLHARAFCEKCGIGRFGTAQATTRQFCTSCPSGKHQASPGKAYCVSGFPAAPTPAPVPTPPTPAPSLFPTTAAPTTAPTPSPTGLPTLSPTSSPTLPTTAPTLHPTAAPTRTPTPVPTAQPTFSPIEPCRPGTFLTAFDGGYCTYCAAGQHASAPGASECVDCAAGRYALTGSATCKDCPAGKFHRSGGGTVAENGRPYKVPNYRIIPLLILL